MESLAGFEHLVQWFLTHMLHLVWALLRLALVLLWPAILFGGYVVGAGLWDYYKKSRKKSP